METGVLKFSSPAAKEHFDKGMSLLLSKDYSRAVQFAMGHREFDPLHAEAMLAFCYIGMNERENGFTHFANAQQLAQKEQRQDELSEITMLLYLDGETTSPAQLTDTKEVIDNGDEPYHGECSFPF